MGKETLKGTAKEGKELQYPGTGTACSHVALLVWISAVNRRSYAAFSYSRGTKGKSGNLGRRNRIFLILQFQITNMTRVAVVTGGNKGIGFEIVRGICKKFDGDVILAARDEGRGKEAVSQLQKDGLNPKFQALDIDCKESIEKFKQFLEKEYGGLDILVNNAAIAYPGASTASVQEQAKNTVRVNFYGTKNVCDALFPLLRPHARVVNLSSSAGMLSKIPNENIREEFKNPELTVEDLCAIVDRYLQDVKSGHHKDKGWAPTTYCMSKIPLTKLSFIQQKQFDKDSREDLVVNAVHPGFVDTDMTNHKGPLSPEDGASAPIYLALLPPNVKSPRGEFVWNDSKVTSWI